MVTLIGYSKYYEQAELNNTDVWKGSFFHILSA